MTYSHFKKKMNYWNKGAGFKNVNPYYTSSFSDLFLILNSSYISLFFRMKHQIHQILGKIHVL